MSRRNVSGRGEQECGGGIVTEKGMLTKEEWEIKKVKEKLGVKGDKTRDYVNMLINFLFHVQ